MSVKLHWALVPTQCLGRIEQIQGPAICSLRNFNFGTSCFQRESLESKLSTTISFGFHDVLGNVSWKTMAQKPGCPLLDANRFQTIQTLLDRKCEVCAVVSTPARANTQASALPLPLKPF